MSENTDKALVLGGGGVVGIAWETGLLAGLASKGVDVVSTADLVVGSSAGATVAAQVFTTPLEKLYKDQIEGTGAPGPAIDVDMGSLLGRIGQELSAEPDPVKARKSIGAMSLEKDRVPEAERRAIIEARLESHEWPEQLVRVTTIQADTGEFKVLDKNSGVNLVDAVAASCAIPVVWPAVTIGGNRFYDGSVRSGTNTDVAEGYGKVLVLEVMKLPENSDVKDIGDSSQVKTISLDETSKEAIGENPLDPDASPAAAKAGYDQGVRIADEVREFWD
ncbi:patatin-like phospholipase family protein [Microbacterium testaceum]|uniref:Patatin n=1 Tax=Microbacterium testaceum TaxID=2033 RepID=A0A2T7VPZ3_MICTE|nr:patatin-like phospholipase family protein [Microbacterium testaceum]PVE58721.1 patatin [Microbacterium testaceum]